MEFSSQVGVPGMLLVGSLIPGGFLNCRFPQCRGRTSALITFIVVHEGLFCWLISAASSVGEQNEHFVISVLL